MKLKYKLPLMGTLVLIIAFISLWVVTQRSALNLVIDYKHRISVVNIEKRVQELEQDIKNGKRVLDAISRGLDSSDLNWETVSSYLYDVLHISMFKEMGLVHEDKTYNITGTEEIGDLSDSGYLKEAFEKRTTVVSDPIYSKVNEIYQIVIASPIIGNNEIKGALIGTIPMENIAEHIYDLNIEGEGYGFLTNRRGDIVLQPKDISIPCENFVSHVGIDEFAGESGYTRYRDCDNIKRYAFFKKIEGTGLVAVISINQKDLYRPIGDIFKQKIILLFVVLILFLIFGNFIISGLLKPIDKLILVMKKVEDGDYTSQIPVNRKDELGDIAVQFNKTIEAVLLKDEELQIMNEELSASFEKINKTSSKLLGAYDEIKKKLQNERLINSLSEIFYSKKELHELLESILVYTEKIINSEHCAIYFYNEEYGSFKITESINFSELDKCISYEKYEGTLGWVVENKEELLITDTSHDPRFASKYSWSADMSMLLQIPIFDEGEEVIGIISYFGNNLNLNFTPYLKQLSKTVSVTIQNSNLIKEIEKTHFGIIMSLVKAIEFKDKYTKGHSERVMKYSLMLGEKLNLSNNELRTLRYGSILHDIGKLAIPDDVLLKTGKLSSEEYNIIKDHSQKGAEFIEDLEFLRDTLFIIRHHHERIDGKGYPDGLKGEEIERLTKIVTIADAFDAITSERTYKDGVLNKKDAVQELRKHKGTQFDSYLVEKFAEVILAD
ncbi:MAG: HD domain-containing protein [Alkaliphilus sp.]|nr:HD domain-containing protein [Alkaliphilus sp.]